MNHYEVLQNNQNYAVIGMRPYERCYACKIHALLTEKGKTAYGLNPNYDEVNGVKLYDDLDDLNKPIDIAVFVVNPTIGITMLENVKRHNIKTIWLQPGTISDELLAKAEELDLNVIEDCVLAVYAKNE